MNREAKWVIIRVVLYFGISFIPDILNVMGESAKYEYWPSGVRITAAALSGTLAGLISIKAYLDGTFQTWNEDRKKQIEADKTI
jgi:rhodanese-related sulfurtransferase